MKTNLLLSRQSFLMLVSTGILALVVVACGSFDIKRVVPETIEMQKQQPFTVSVNIKGGVESEFGGMQEADPEIFTQALLQTIAKTKIFTAVVDKSQADYQLDIILYKMRQQASTMDYTQFLNANWRLKHRANKETVFQQRIDTQGTATLGDALGGDMRTVMATEKAMKANISEGVMKISQLNLQ